MLTNLIEQARQSIIEHRRRVYGQSVESVLHPPATAETVQDFESARGVRFPPSYRQFLLLHNGWEDYAYGFTLIGVFGEHTARALQDIEETIEIWKDAWAQEYGTPTEESIREYVRRGDSRNPLEAGWLPYLPWELPFGTNFNGGLLFFRVSSSSPDGECEVFAWETGCGVRASYTNFVEMLRCNLEQLRAEAARYESQGSRGNGG